MKILTADYILTCDDDFSIIEDGAVCFNEKIIEVGEKDEVIKNNPYAIVKHLSPNSVIMPGLINTHTHLEYSANKTTLIYGDFIKWLQSVIANRDKLKEDCGAECYKNAIEQMLLSGVTAFGNISSFGDDLDACFESPQKIVYFNEILGSNPDFIDDVFLNFEKRLQQSYEFFSRDLIPAVSIHSIYSTHPMLMDMALNIAKKDKLLISAHFMESLAEREWIDRGEGDFYEFLKIFNQNPKPMQNAMEFLEKFRGLKTIFAHGVVCKKEELKFISKNGSLSHCLVSNRVLNNPLLNIEEALKEEVSITIGTDGLSSNNSLNIWDELRAVLFAHSHIDVLKLSKYLITFATVNGAKALGLDDVGMLKIGKSADIITVILPDKVLKKEQLPLELILHTKEVKSGYIDGERCV